MLGELLSQWDATAGNLSPELWVKDSSWIAAANGEAVGWLNGHHRQDCIWRRIIGYEDKPESWTCTYLSLMFVRPDARLGGIGSGLLRAFEADAVEAGNSLVILNPSRAHSPTLSQFYERNGYTVRQGSRGYPSHLMAKDLA